VCVCVYERARARVCVSVCGFVFSCTLTYIKPITNNRSWVELFFSNTTTHATWRAISQNLGIDIEIKEGKVCN
jgi:hypothetical protein